MRIGILEESSFKKKKANSKTGVWFQFLMTCGELSFLIGTSVHGANLKRTRLRSVSTRYSPVSGRIVQLSLFRHVPNNRESFLPSAKKKKTNLEMTDGGEVTRAPCTGLKK